MLRFLTPANVSKHIWLLLIPAFLLTMMHMYIGMFVEADKWKFLDWMINYSAGFVRRGLFGYLALEINQNLGLPIQWSIFLLQFVAYGLFFACAYELLHLMRDIRPVLWLVLSPFMFIFQIADPRGGFRKDILFLALLAGMLLLISRHRDSPWAFRAWLICLALFPLIILGHEMFVFYAPYLLFPLFLIGFTWRRAIIGAIVFAPSVAVGLAVAMNSGTPEQVAYICSSLLSWLPPSEALDNCATDGAIAWLGKTPADGLALLGEEMPYLGPSMPFALLLSGIALIPLIPFMKQLKADQPKMFRLFLLTVLVAIAGSLVLFLVAVDWGRFMQVHLVAIALTAMALVVWGQDHDRLTVPPEKLPSPFNLSGPTMVLIGIVYLFSWSLQHYDVLVQHGVWNNLAQMAGYGADAGAVE